MKNMLAFLLPTMFLLIIACNVDTLEPNNNGFTNDKTPTEKLIATWKTTTIFNAETGANLFDPVEDDDLFILTFSDNGTVEATGESMILSGTYAANSQLINVLDIDLTLPNNYTPTVREDAFFEYLEAANEFDFSGTSLHIEETNKRQATFVAQ